MKKHNKKFEVKNITSLTFITFIVAGAVMLFALPKDKISAEENRVLSKSPVPTAYTLTKGGYSRGVNSYLNDHFPFRDSLIDISSRLSGLVKYQGGDVTLIPQSSAVEGSSEFAAVANDVMIYDGRAMEVFKYDDLSVERYADALNGIQRSISQKAPETRVFSMVVPTSYEFYAPAAYKNGVHSESGAIDKLNGLLSDGVIPVDAEKYLRRVVAKGEYVYFRTDHHWTTEGAYAGYKAFCAKAGLKAMASKGKYTVPGEFLGTLYNSVRRDSLKAQYDSVEVHYPPEVESCYGYADAAMNTEYEFFPLMDPEGYDNKYITFLGGDKPLVKLTGANHNGKTLLVVKDSYSNAMSLFFLENYETVYLLDPRLTPANLADFCREHEVDDVLLENYALVLSNCGMADILGGLYGE